MSCFFTIIKTVSISCNWTDQLLFTYKMALFTSHSHCFVCGWNIVIKFMYLAGIYMYLAINWWKIQQNMHSHFLEIPVFLGGCFIMPDPVCCVKNMGIRSCPYMLIVKNPFPIKKYKIKTFNSHNMEPRVYSKLQSYADDPVIESLCACCDNCFCVNWNVMNCGCQCSSHSLMLCCLWLLWQCWLSGVSKGI